MIGYIEAVNCCPVKNLHVLCKGQLMGVPSLNDLAVDGT